MTENVREIHILLADDDEEDCMLCKKALKRNELVTSVSTVHDGEQLIQYLRREKGYVDDPSWHRPSLILLDLNMPRKDGREALAEIKVDDNLRSIPVVVLTTSKAREDVEKTFFLGANAFICKPVTFPNLLNTMETLVKFWFETGEIPEQESKQ